MKRIAILIILTNFVIGLTVAQKSADLDDLPELKNSWNNFKVAVKKADKNQLKFLCEDSVIFSMVIGDMHVLSSSAESDEGEIPGQDNSMHKNYFYLSFESFFNDELAFLFDANMLSRMDDLSKLRIVRVGDNDNEYKFFITVTDPDEEFAGIEMALRFRKAKGNGYLFCGVDTIQ